MRRLLPVLLVVLAACSDGDGDGRQASPTTTTTSPPTSTTATSSTTTTSTTAAATPGTCPPPPPRAQPPERRPQYALRLDVRLPENAVVGTTEVRFTPDLGIDRLVFRLWPNGPRLRSAGARLDITAVQLDGRPVQWQVPDLTTLEVPAAVGAGRTVTAGVEWKLTLPGPTQDRISRSGDAVRLGSFFPILAWEPGVGWAREPPTTGFAEASVAATADFTATVAVPSGLDVLATGVPDSSGTWRASAVPDFGLSVGRFTTAAATTGGTQVTVGVHEGIAESPRPYLDRVVGSLEDLTRRYGPYPWPAFTLAITPNLRGGIEYPMHVMQGSRTVGRTTPHEVGHQWFYALVQNNQGRDPWLDEGLASWAEARIEGTLRSFATRTVPAAGRGRLGEPMTFWESRQSAYYRSVYVQGAQALAALGPPDLVDCALHHYVARNAYRVARPADLVAALRTVFPEAPSTLARFGVRT
ncbi:MAG TPA: M1 family aminopeptidase [Acidimicrobiales bacterium]|nr:M1 family aminopeptidase [Acidimicrobiales bacterium]